MLIFEASNQYSRRGKDACLNGVCLRLHSRTLFPRLKSCLYPLVYFTVNVRQTKRDLQTSVKYLAEHVFAEHLLRPANAQVSTQLKKRIC